MSTSYSVLGTSPLPTIHSSLASPRSSTSSATDGTSTTLPLTPWFESDEAGIKLNEMDEGSSGDTRLAVQRVDMEDISPGEERPGMDIPKTSPPEPGRSAEPPSAQFAAFSFGGPSNLSATAAKRESSTSRPRYTGRPASKSISSGSGSSPNRGVQPRPFPSPTGPMEGFSFGSCPSNQQPLIGTPIAERGSFEYPVHPNSYHRGSGDDLIPHSPSSARSSVSIPLGETHRRGSIIARPLGSMEHRGSVPEPPVNRRSSTTSAIATIPQAGHRPSILHSVTVGAGPDSPPLPLASTHRSASLSGPSYFSSATLPHRRAGSLIFQPKNLPSPVPPSLLARRGSLPQGGLSKDQKISLPPTINPGLTLRRGSSTVTYPVLGHTTTSHALYHRRESLVSDGGASSGSSHTIMDNMERDMLTPNDTRRGSLFRPAPGANNGEENNRRFSMPFMPVGNAISMSAVVSAVTQSPRSKDPGNLNSPKRPTGGNTHVSYPSPGTYRRASQHGGSSSLGSSSEEDEEVEHGGERITPGDTASGTESEALVTPDTAGTTGSTGFMGDGSKQPGSMFQGFSDPFSNSSGEMEKRRNSSISSTASTRSGDGRGQGGGGIGTGTTKKRPTLETIQSSSGTEGHVEDMA